MFAWARASEKVTAAVPEQAMGLEELRAFVAGLGGAAQVAAIAQMMGFPVPAEVLEGAEEDEEGTCFFSILRDEVVWVG